VAKLKSVKIKESTYQRLNELAGILQKKFKRPVSLDEVINILLKKAEINTKSILDFAGIWEISDDEEEELFESLKAAWSQWKMKE